MNRTLCVVRRGDSCLGIDVALVGEVVALPAIVRLPRCPDAILGLSELRGTPLAVVDLLRVLELPVAAPVARQLLVLRTDVRLAGVPIDACIGVFPAMQADFRPPNRDAEPSWVAGFQTFTAHGGLHATVIDGADLLARLGRLRFEPSLRQQTAA